jgi:hypothetical protein
VSFASGAPTRPRSSSLKLFAVPFAFCWARRCLSFSAAAANPWACSSPEKAVPNRRNVEARRKRVMAASETRCYQEVDARTRLAWFNSMQREWTTAKAWIARELRRGAG